MSGRKIYKSPSIGQQRLLELVHEADSVYGGKLEAGIQTTTQRTSSGEQVPELMTIRQASEWATEYLGKKVTPSNISYLIQYGRIRKRGGSDGAMVDRQELAEYYRSYLGRRELAWKNRLGDDLDWHLSFDHLKEADTTKHVHRLHPYKGKFIPQLVEYFLDDHVDEFKKQVCFSPGDVVLDPFCGSGTTLVEANELGMHAVGIDVSSFNALISNVKVGDYNLTALYEEVQKIIRALRSFIAGAKTQAFEADLAERLSAFNNERFPLQDHKSQKKRGLMSEDAYGEAQAKEFLEIYFELINKYDIDLRQTNAQGFLGKWYLKPVRVEIEFVLDLVKQVKDATIKRILTIILSRTIRSCRATTHFDLATLKDPVATTYYCPKHGKVCKPLFSILSWWERYCTDTVTRLAQFRKLRTKTYQICLTGDSRAIDILKELEKRIPLFATTIKEKGIRGIFSSPPYVGLIDYHEQHAYAYELFGFDRHDELEISPLSKGQGREARDSYVVGISEVLNNCRQVLVPDYNVFLVANDKFNLYPTIAEKASMRIVNQFKRPVLNRTERDKSAYSESIFHLKQKEV